MDRTKFSNTGKKGNKNNKNYILAGVIGLLLITLLVIYIQLGIIKLPGSSQKESVQESASINASKQSPSLVPKTQSLLPKVDASSSAGQNPAQRLTPANTLDPFSGPFSLSGVVVNATGKNVAILESPTKTYVVAENESLEGAWTLEKISIDSVILKYQDKRYSLTLGNQTK